MRLSELNNSEAEVHLRIDLTLLKDRLVEFEGLGNIIILKRKKKQDFKLMMFNRSRWGISKKAIHGASYARYSKVKSI